MTSEDQLRAKLRKIEALFAGAGTEGERDAAAAAMGRIQEKLANARQTSDPIEMRFSLGDQWSRRLFVTLCRRYGLKPYRYHRQRHTTVMLMVPRPFIDDILWPEFEQLNGVLVDYLAEMTDRIISEELFSDLSEASEVAQPLQIE
jgi:hypothetical protein